MEREAAGPEEEAGTRRPRLERGEGGGYVYALGQGRIGGQADRQEGWAETGRLLLLLLVLWL